MVRGELLECYEGIRVRRTSTKTPLGSWFSALAAGGLLALVNAAAIAWWLDGSTVPTRVRGLHYLMDAAQHLALALLLPSGQAAYRRVLKPASLERTSWRQQRWLRPLLPWAWGGLGLMLLLSPTLAEDFNAFANSRFPGPTAGFVKWCMVGSCAAGLAGVLVLLGRYWSATLALLATTIAIGLFGANHWLFKHNYPGVHFLIAIAGLGLVSVGWAPLRWFRGGPRPWLRRIAAAVAVASVLALFVRPSRTLLNEQLKTSGSVMPLWLTRLRLWTHRQAEAALNPSRENWFEQSARAATPPSRPRLLPDAPIVVLITIDAVRADVMQAPHHLERFPNLRALKEQGVYFSQARAPGSQTVTSLSGVFSGRYFSQQYWTPHPAVGYLFLGDDLPARFPELLRAGGYQTHTAAATYFLVNTFGIVRGFEHELFIKMPDLALTDYTPGQRLTAHLSDTLKRARNEPLFLFAHYLDSHFPYKAGGKSGSDFERYLRAIEYVDRELGVLRRTLDELDLWQRTLLVVASDHGEAFGEHNSQHHATTLYEEQLHVPLIMVAPWLSARTIDSMVSLIDLGPTLLDLAGQPTPGHFMGQSLVPLLRGEPAHFSRPVVAEGRLKKALYFPDGFKLIVDDRLGTEELYDLEHDPKELTNLIDAPDADAPRRLDTLRRFFRVHTLARPGYEIPYRP